MSELTLADAARMMREAVKDKSYRAFPLGGEAGAYLRWKRGMIAESTYRDYESTLDKLARYFADLTLADLEPPVGVERLEEFLEHQWGDAAPRTYNKAHAGLAGFTAWAVLKGKLHGDPMRQIGKRRKRDVARGVFTDDQVQAILSSQPDVRDRLCLRILFHLGIRKGALQAIQFKHFDHAQRRLTVFTKGGKVRQLPIVDPAIWNELERWILEWGAQPDDFLLPRRKAVPHYRHGRQVVDVVEYRDKPMGVHGLHNWWYRCLERAGVVDYGVTAGEKMHKARHSAGQRMLDRTRGNLKAVQKLLGHASIQTTADIYVDWDIDQLAATMREEFE